MDPQGNWAAVSTRYLYWASHTEAGDVDGFVLPSSLAVAPYLHMPLLCKPLTTLSFVLGGGTLRTCVLRPPGIYGPEEQRHLPRVAVGPPSLPVTRGRRSQVDVVCMLTVLLQLSVTASV